MAIFWYYCNNYGVNFSWIFTGLNDAKGCPKCHSKDIVRIKNKNNSRRLKNGKQKQ